MKMTNNYESPEFIFQEMRILERVADTCWGYAYAWFDGNNNGTIDEFERVDLESLGLKKNGCQGSTAREELRKIWGNIPGITEAELDSAVATNNKNRLVKGSYS